MDDPGYGYPKKFPDNPTIAEALVLMTKKFNDAEARILELETKLAIAHNSTVAAQADSRSSLGLARDAMVILKNELARREK